MRNKIVIGFVVVALSLIIRLDAMGQANKTNSGEVTCPATGTSIQVLPARSSRFSYSLNNQGGGDVRIGYTDSGTGALNSGNSWLLKSGQPYSDSTPGVLQNRVVCMATGGAGIVLNFLETYR